MAHTELGRKILDRLIEDLGDMHVVDAMPKQDGRNMIMVIAPTKKQLEARVVDADRRREPHRRGVRTVPKMKTHRSTAKRFRITRNGKVLHRKATGNHMLTKKSPQPAPPCRGHVRSDRGDARRSRGCWGA